MGAKLVKKNNITICLFAGAKLLIFPGMTKKNMFYNMFLE